MVPIKTDCRFFRGDRPCRPLKDQRLNQLCQGCESFEKIGFKIIIIKFAALGDVLRTTALLPALRRTYPGCHITWIAGEAGVELLKLCEGIDQLLPFNLVTHLILSHQKFDLALCLDKDAPAIQIMASLDCPDKRGIALGPNGTPIPANPHSEYYYQLGLVNNEKFFINKKSYQQLLFEALNIPWSIERYAMAPCHRDQSHEFLRSLGMAISHPPPLIIGVAPGSGPRFAGKRWPLPHFLALGRKLIDQFNCKMLILGGIEDEPLLAEWAKGIRGDQAEHTFFPGSQWSLAHFTRIIAGLDLLISGDTLPMHLAIGQKIPTLVLFGSTCEQEIELYGLGAKVSRHLPCSPCYLARCPTHEECQSAILPEEIFARARELLAPTQGTMGVNPMESEG